MFHSKTIKSRKISEKKYNLCFDFFFVSYIFYVYVYIVYGSFWEVYIILCSANSVTKVYGVVGCSAVYKLNRKGKEISP